MRGHAAAEKRSQKRSQNVQRRIDPEILDSLPADAPDAIASRRDLRRINFLMGNERWLLCEVRRIVRLHPGLHIVEPGAGDGSLACKLAALNGVTGVTCIDLAPRPQSLRMANLEWIRGNALELDWPHADLVIANLFLHHFETDALRLLLQKCRCAAPLLLACEPARRKHSLALFAVLRLSGINRVTWHDGRVSIRAGFLPGEIAGIFGSDWEARATETFLGAVRIAACARKL
jgi:2-polyprenyl-3-methyl-5-hydroxy-6-metoxy-1,4-benzoquinol methylase